MNPETPSHTHTMEELTEDQALQAFSDAEWKASRAAEAYSERVIERVREYLEAEAQDPRREGEEVDDILWELADNLDAVIYTHRARALVIGQGEDETREAFKSELGEETPATWEALAHFAIVQACNDTVRQMEDWREERGW